MNLGLFLHTKSVDHLSLIVVDAKNRCWIPRQYWHDPCSGHEAPRLIYVDDGSHGGHDLDALVLVQPCSQIEAHAHDDDVGKCSIAHGLKPMFVGEWFGHMVLKFLEAHMIVDMQMPHKAWHMEPMVPIGCFENIGEAHASNGCLSKGMGSPCLPFDE